MSRFVLAFRIWWRTLFSPEVGRQVALVLEGAPAEPAAPPPSPVEPPARKEVREPKLVPPPKPLRSDALTLVATLQREGRLVDFLKESIAEYSDAQIGAVVRNVHRECGKVLDRMFQIRPVVTEEEGALIQAPPDAERYRLLGNVTGQPPYRGRLVHHGWEAAHCEVPTWTGSESGARVIAPVEVELT